MIEQSLREKCRNTEFFLVRICSNVGKYGPEKTLYLEIFHAVSDSQTVNIQIVKSFLRPKIKKNKNL